MAAEYFFTEEHEMFRQSLRDFLNREVVPKVDEWEKNERIPRDMYRKFGEMGYFGLDQKQEYGGSDLDFFYTVVLLEEISMVNSAGFSAGITAHPILTLSHISKVGNPHLIEKYLIPGIRGEKIGCLCITEPNAGSDVAAIQTTAEKQGDSYVINGSKTFITNGVFSDYLIVTARTRKDAGASGISLFVVDRQTPGLSATQLKKLGWHASDTGEIHFDDVRIPAKNLLGEENKGFYYIMQRFELERLVMAISANAGSEACLEYTKHYMNERKAFGRTINKFQVLRHRIAQLTSELEQSRIFTYTVCRKYQDGIYAVRESAMAKLLATELSDKLTYECLQCFGGYGYMEEYKVARMFRDSRIGTIGGGTSEIMREIIAKMLIDEVSYGSNQPPRGLPSARDIILGLPERLRKDKAENASRSLHFKIEGPGGGSFTVCVSDGSCSVREGLIGDADCIVKTNDEIYAGIETGNLDPQQAFLQGSIEVSDIGVMMEFSRWFSRLN